MEEGKGWRVAMAEPGRPDKLRCLRGEAQTTGHRQRRRVWTPWLARNSGGVLTPSSGVRARGACQCTVLCCPPKRLHNFCV
eukprot:2433979-Rhodomonas_salina.1